MSNSWVKGDPQQPYSDNADADTFWWWFSTIEPGFPGGGVVHAPNGPKLVNDSFEHAQHHVPGNWWWWDPVWLTGNANGTACAIGMVSQNPLNNGFEQDTPPAPGTKLTGNISGHMLANWARADLTLPGIKINTSPARGHDVVNLPVWVWVSFKGNPFPTQIASVPLPGGGVLSATVTASRPRLSIHVSGGQARTYNNCGMSGSRYRGQSALAIPRCGVTFLAPSAGGYTLSATETWTVRWTDNQGDSGGFPSPPWPLPVSNTAESVTVKEIQSINTESGNR